ncbi:MAG: ABC transporter permease [Gemmatimonadota bacterium]
MNHDRVWWRIAWRNLWRHRSRTLITASGLGLGYMASVVMVGLSDGMAAELIENGTRLVIGQIQIHAPDYLPERKMYATIGGDAGTDVDSLLARVEREPDVVAAAPRLYGGGLVSSGENTRAGLLMGVDPDREARVTRLMQSVTGPGWSAGGVREIILGKELARQLSLSIGDEVVLVAPAADGSLGNDLYTLVGLLDTGTPGMDGNYGLLRLGDLQELLAMGPGLIHEVVIRVTRPWDTRAIAAQLQKELDTHDPPVDVRPWQEMRPEVAESVALMDSMYFLIILIIFAMAVFGVANAMIIGAFERRKEFAVVQALGVTGRNLSRTVVYEGVILGALSLLAGAALTFPLMVWWHNAPPDLSGLVGSFTWSGSTWRPILRVEYSVRGPMMSALALFITAVVAALYPAWKTTRIPPADALSDR